jgi:hypothetical protein
MNIFYLHENPTLSAKAMTNKHIVKMIIEAAQLLSTAHRVLDGYPVKKGRWTTYLLEDKQRNDTLYKSTHYNHPCAVWVRESFENYYWLYKHFLALCQEYRNRYGKIHESENKLGHILRRYPESMKKKKFTPPALAMPEEYKVEGDPVQSYRNYYEAEKLKNPEDIQRYKEVLGL